jgi:hypothetical protein
MNSRAWQSLGVFTAIVYLVSLTRPRLGVIPCPRCNRVRASFEFRESKIRWNLFNDLPEFKRSHNIGADRGDIFAVVKSESKTAPA